MKSSLTRLSLAVVFALSMAAPSVTSAAQDSDLLGTGGLNPAGTWISENRDSTYEVNLCGEDGVSLCARLSWIPERHRNARNVEFIGKWMVDEAPRVGPLKWKDKINMLGYEVDGTVDLVSINEVRVTACVFIVLCESAMLYRTHFADGRPVEES